MSGEGLPKPLIETVASETLSGLRRIKEELKAKGEDISKKPEGHPVQRALENAGFLNHTICPVVKEFISRTKRELIFPSRLASLVYLIPLGYNYVKFGFTKDENYKVVGPTTIFHEKILTPEVLIKSWDEDETDARDAIRHFGSLSKEQLLRKFEDVTRKFSK